MQETSQQLSLPIFQKLTATASDFHVRLSALLESDTASQIQEALYSLKSCGWLKSESLKFFSLKMLQDFLTTRGGVTFGVIISAMAELGYSVEWQVLDSQNFGVPQHRERVFIVGHLGNGGGRKVFPVGQDGAETAELQGHETDNRIVTNTLDTRIEAETRGAYIADRQTDR